MTRELKVIHTKSKEGEPNGWVLPIAHIDSGDEIPQVYITTIFPDCFKGPHLHLQRKGRFVCIQGEALFVTRVNGEYKMESCGPLSGYKLITVEAGVPCAIYNIGDGVSKILNMPLPPWRDNSDEHTVDDWEYKQYELTHE